MSVDFESFLWGIGFGKEEENHKTKSKAKHAIKNPILKLENLQIKNNTLTVKLRNISKKAEAVDQVTFRKILKRPKIIKKLFLKEKDCRRKLNRRSMAGKIHYTSRRQS